MIDHRLHRIALIPALAALLAVLFSLQPAPPALESDVAPSAFSGSDAAAAAERLLEVAPDRPPGGEGDAAAADFVAKRFGAIEAGTASEQRLEAEVDGDARTLRNVLLRMPGRSDSTLLVLAHRDGAGGAGATGVLLELAEVLASTDRERTLILASTSGGTAGAAGARELVRAIAEPEKIRAAVALARPGLSPPRAPRILTFSTDARSTSRQLVSSARLAVERQMGADAGPRGPLEQLVRLAVPSGLGEAAPLIAQGIDAVTISGTGERLPPSDRTGADAVSPTALGELGRAALGLTFALDPPGAELRHGPETHLQLGDNLLPGWTLSLLGLALLLAPLAALVDAALRAMRRGAALAPALRWSARGALPWLAALLCVYALASLGLLPTPAFPYEAGSAEPGAGAIAGLALLGLATSATVAWIRPLDLPRQRQPRLLAVAAGVPAVLGSLLVWASNPYLGLLAAPLAHLWLLSGHTGLPGRRALVPAAALVASAPLVISAAALGSALGLGGLTPWHLLVLAAIGQIDFWAAVGLALLGAGTALALAIGMRPAAPDGGGGSATHGSPQGFDLMDGYRMSRRAPVADRSFRPASRG